MNPENAVRSFICCKPQQSRLVIGTPCNMIVLSVLMPDLTTQDENIGSAISFALGVQRARHIQIVSTWDDEQQSDQPSATSSLAAEAAKAQAQVRTGQQLRKL